MFGEQFTSRCFGSPGAGLMSQPYIFDDFLSGLGTTGNIGNLSWLLGAGVVTGQNGQTNHPGIIRLSSGAAAGVIGRLLLNPVLATGFSTYTNNIKLLQFVLYCDAQVNGTLFFGLSSLATVVLPAERILFYRVLGGANLFAGTQSLGLQTDTDLGATFAGAWHLYEIALDSTGAFVDFFIDGILVATHNTNIPLGFTLNPVICIHTSVAAAKLVDVDYFGLQFHYMPQRW